MAHNPGRLSWQEIANTQAGVITIRDAVAAGMTRYEIRARLSDGRWQQPFRGVLLTGPAPATRLQEIWGALAAVGPDAVLAGSSAAALAGFAGHDDGPVTVLIPAFRRVTRPPGVVLRHSARLDGTELQPVARPRRTAPGRSIIDMAEWAPDRDAAHAVLLDAVRQRFVTVATLRDALGRRGPISRRTLITETLDDLSRDAPSVTEVMYRRIEGRCGLPPGRVTIDGPPDEPTARLRVSYEPWQVQVEVHAAGPSMAIAPPAPARPSSPPLERLPIAGVEPGGIRAVPAEAARDTTVRAAGPAGPEAGAPAAGNPATGPTAAAPPVSGSPAAANLAVGSVAAGGSAAADLRGGGVGGSGAVLVRVAAGLVREAPEEVAALVRGALRDRGWPAAEAPAAIAS